MENLLRKAWPPGDWQDLTMLVAVSGGADSVALLRGLHAIRSAGNGRLVVAHFNHELRDEADGDEAFVRELAAGLALDCSVGRAHRPAHEPRPTTGLEESARHARYDFLRAAAVEIGARYVATAHTADDQAETVLHRILRGTGIAGLRGMRRTRPLAEGVSLIRPLLCVRREELTTYLAGLRQTFRQDATNAERRFTRNRLRHELLPQLAEQYNANVVEALLRLSRLAGEAQDVVDNLVADLLRRCVRSEGSRLLIEGAELANQPRYLVRELLVAAWRRQGWPEQAMGLAEWELLADMLLASDPGRGSARMLPGGVKVERQADALVLERS
ncbi:MAG TPA: tRNA lysidine(34) synthetase TilS [Pirellulales bacterium]|jgi:tRNA(Ile)-lysidine synthase|nr:tRNA lysidine(34) synthetase TilS [Pirellulales bacterium]